MKIAVVCHSFRSVFLATVLRVLHDDGWIHYSVAVECPICATYERPPFGDKPDPIKTTITRVVGLSESRWP
jgi:hypothetical protein